MELIAGILLRGLRSTLQSALATSISPICPCCRIPHRRLCHEVISVREGVSGEIMSCSTYNFDKLEPAEARTNASKIKGPARVVAHGKQYWPREKCLAKVKGERKKRNKCCVMDSRYADPTLVDPELPSSWKARQVAVQLSDSDDVSSVAAAHGLPWPTADRYISDGQRASPKTAGCMSAAMQSLTDSTHWPKFAPEVQEKPTANRTPPVPISRLALVDNSSEDWELGVSATRSDASSLCNAGLIHLSDILGAGTHKKAAPEDVTAEMDVQEREDGGESEWDMLSQSASDWDIVSEVDMDDFL